MYGKAEKYLVAPHLLMEISDDRHALFSPPPPRINPFAQEVWWTPGLGLDRIEKYIVSTENRI
jgi:hypothetical protein